MRAMGAVLVSAVLVATAVVGLSADAKVQQRTQVKLEGVLGKMAGIFGGKAAKEGVVSTVAVKGNRRMTTTDTTAELVDLDAEKVYRIDLRGKTFTVQTFDEIRKQLEKTESKAAAQSAPKSDAKQPEMEIEIDIKKTGQQKTIAGFACDEVVMTLTMHEKDKTIDQSGGMVVTSDMFMAPKVEAMQDNVAFERRYFEKLYGPEVMPAMKDLAQALVMYPGLKTAMARLQKEGASVSGTALLTTVTVSGAGNPDNGSTSGNQPAPGGVSGALGGLLGRKKQAEPAPAGGAPGGTSGGKALTTILTTVTEVLSIGASAADDVEIPAGFKQK